jgi:tetratricopeptide (TPR) repeat protein
LASWTGMADNRTGINLYESGIYSAAKVFFLKQWNNGNASPEEKAETCYYLGEIYVKLNKLDSAYFYYNKGLEALPTDPFNKIGTSKLVLKEFSSKRELTKEMKKTLEESFNSAIKTNKKDIRILLAVAEAYAYAGDYDKAAEYIKQAKKANAKSGLPYLLEGDIVLYKNQENRGEAGTKYDHAINFSPDLIGAYIKSARIYMPINSAVSEEKLTAIQNIDPAFNGHYHLLGELYEKQGNSKLAVQHYVKFIDGGHYDEEHLLKYASLLYYDKQYDKVLPVISPVLKKHPDNLVAKRLHAYALSKTQSGQQSVNAIKHFMQTAPKDKLIPLDYLCYAEQLEANKQYAEAAINYAKVIQLDDSKKDLLKEIGDMYDKNHQPDSAIFYYTRYLDFIGQPDPAISFNIGRNYYYLGTDSLVTPENRLAALYKADSTFTEITELAPTSFLGYFWRARTNSMIDPEASRGLAKPYYEKVIEILLNQADRYKRELIEGYKYLGYYYYMQADAVMKKNNNNPDKAKEEFLTAKSFFSKVLELNPDDAVAKDAIEGIKIK